MTQPAADWIAAAEYEFARTGIPASFQLAQAIVETGWGKHVIGGFNLFGMKCPVDANGTPLYPHVMERTAEQHPDDSVYYIEAPFRSFTSVDEAFAAHAELLCKPAYAKAKALLPDLDAYIDAVSPIYATGIAYAKTIKAVIAGSDLTQYDRETPVATMIDQATGLPPAATPVSQEAPAIAGPPVAPELGVQVTTPSPVPGQITISTDALSDHAVTLLTGAIRMVGAALVAKGYFDASTVNAAIPEVVGILMSVGGQIWANWRTQNKRTTGATL